MTQSVMQNAHMRNCLAQKAAEECEKGVGMCWQRKGGKKAQRSARVEHKTPMRHGDHRQAKPQSTQGLGMTLGQAG